MAFLFCYLKKEVIQKQVRSFCWVGIMNRMLFLAKQVENGPFYATFFLRLWASASNPASISTFGLPRSMKRLK